MERLTMKIHLRPIALGDGNNIVKWRNSVKVNCHCYSKEDISLESNEKFYKAYIETGKYKQFIVERLDEDFGVLLYPIATLYLKDIDNENHRCELCVFTSDDQEWNTDSQSLAVKQLLEKAFSEYGVHKVYTYVFSEYSDELELMKSAGFEIEGLLKGEAKNIDGEYVDIYRMMIINDKVK